MYLIAPVGAEPHRFNVLQSVLRSLNGAFGVCEHAANAAIRRLDVLRQKGVIKTSGVLHKHTLNTPDGPDRTDVLNDRISE